MKIMRLFAVSALIILFASIVCAAEVGRIATIEKMSGSVEVKIAEGNWAKANIGMTLREGDSIRTKDASWAILNLGGANGAGSVEVKQNSDLKLAQFVENKEAATETTLLDLSLGEVLIKAKKLHSEKCKFEVKTPTSIVGVRGTTFSVAVEAVE